MNIAVLQGSLSRPPESRPLPSGDRLLLFEVTVPPSLDRKAESVPVCWFDAPAAAADYEPETEVLVVGRVRRRFFQTAGGVQSRTEVVADQVVPARQAKKAERLVLGAITALEEHVAGAPV